MERYERLSALDASFLGIEDANVHMHVAALLVFDRGPLATADGGVDAGRIRTFVESRLHEIPRYRHRLAWTPVERHPVWVEDPAFNLFYHVRHIALPRPGDVRQLKRLTGRIVSQKLDLTKPPWELWVIEGLAEERFAALVKMHHCAVDGIGGVELFRVLLAPAGAATGTALEPPVEWHPAPAPRPLELLAGAVWRRATMPLALASRAWEGMFHPRAAIARVGDTIRGVGEVLRSATRATSSTPLNVTIGPHRRFDWIRTPLADAKLVRERLGGTVNDVVLAMVSGALRRFLASRGTDVDSLELRALIPVNIRSTTDREVGNRIAQVIARLPVDEPDLERRYRRVVDTTRSVKHSHQVAGSELFEELGEVAETAVITQMYQLAAVRRAYNLIVTNVPGPPVPLHLLGAPLLEAYPLVPLFPTQALGIALFS